MTTKKQNVLVVGSGGREHALVNALAVSPTCGAVFAYPGNDGISKVATCLNPSESLESVVRSQNIDVVIFGPEQPLVDGEADRLRDMAIVVGPSKAAAQLEGSKSFMKEVAYAAGVPSANFKVFNDSQMAEAKKYVQDHGGPIVIKASGLAAGKGVVVAQSLKQALDAVEDCLSGAAFGDAGKEVVIEECLIGSEISLFHLVRAGKPKFLGAAQDHKRQLDGDKGPNTGGMGTFSPSPLLTPTLCAQVEADIITPVLQEMEQRGASFEGFLFTGLMLTQAGPKLLEFNVRMGDPETQSLLPLVTSDFLQGLIDPQVPVELSEHHAVTVVLAAPGYPESPEKGLEMPPLPENSEQVRFTVAGAEQEKDTKNWRSTGGRVLGVTGIGTSHEQARKRAYEAVQAYNWTAAQFRTDIGVKAK